jgi:hypothetical protein
MFSPHHEISSLNHIPSEPGLGACELEQMSIHPEEVYDDVDDGVQVIEAGSSTNSPAMVVEELDHD